jgi:hypothetical protein
VEAGENTAGFRLAENFQAGMIRKILAPADSPAGEEATGPEIADLVGDQILRLWLSGLQGGRIVLGFVIQLVGETSG